MAQLKSTNITGNLAVTGNILASKIIKLGGTENQILMADGNVIDKSSIQGTTYTGGTGISIGTGNVINHSNSVTAITTAGLYKVKYDAQGHITGTSAITKADITGLGIPGSDTDFGATSIEVTGTGNAVTAASYDADTRKITLTKGTTFLTSHQSLADYVKGPASATDNAVARFDAATGKLIQNSGVTIDDSNNISTAGSLKLTNNGDILWNSGSWWQRIKITDDSTANTNVFEFQQSSDSGSNYTSLFTILDNGTVSAKGFVDADLSPASDKTKNDYVLLAGGGTKALSDFGTVNNGTLTMNTSGTGISGSQTFTANQSTAATFTVTLDSSSAGNRAANKVVLAAAAGQINTEKLAITSGTTVKATYQYNSTDDCVELVWA